MHEMEQENSGTSFIASNVEEKYQELLNIHGISYTSHSSRFTDKLLENITGLAKDSSTAPIKVHFDKNISFFLKTSCNAPNLFMAKLREVIQSVREAKQNNEFDGQFKADCEFSCFRSHSE